MKKLPSVLVLSWLVVAGCSHDLGGPQPQVSVLEPALVCNGLDTTVTISGDGLSPAEEKSLTDHPRLALPRVSLVPSLTLEGKAWSGDPVQIDEDLLSWSSQQSMTMGLKPGLQPGVYDIQLDNFNGNQTVLEDGLVVVPPPELDKVDPDLICVEQSARTLTLTGRYFLRAGSSLPVVIIGDREFPASALDGCEQLPGPVADAELCTTLTVDIDRGALAPGPYGVAVRNPEPAGCTSQEDVTLAVVPLPVIEKVDPDLVCVEQGDGTITLTGQGFLSIDGNLPAVTIGSLQVTADSTDGCTAVEGTLLDARSCTTLVLTLPQGSLSPGSYPVSVTNPDPAGCSSEEQVTMAVVPPPVLEKVDPDLVCVEEGDNTLTLTGQGFLSVDGELPMVTIGNVTVTADSAGDCNPVAGTLHDAYSCTTLVATLPQNALPEGSHPVSVTNPAPAACSSEENVSIAVVGSPEITAPPQPDLVCTGEDESLVLTGDGFLDAGGALPSVTIGGQTLQASSVSGCSDVGGTQIPTRSCTTLTVDIPAGTLPEGQLDVSVTNPAPAACSSPPVTLYALPPPVVDASRPSPPCTQDPTALDITGSGFAVVDGVQPVVEVEGSQVNITSMSGCTAYPGPAETVQICTGIAVDLPAGLISIGSYSLTVFNPDPPGCQAVFDSAIGLPPTIDSISPVRICETGGQVTVNGSNFADGAVVSIDGTDVPTAFVGPTRLLADVPAGFAGGLYDVIVTNPDGCSTTMEQALQIVELPLVYYVDPPVVYNGVNTQVTIFASGIAGTVTDVSMRPTGQPGPVSSIDFNFNPLKPNRVQAIIPQGTTPGHYDIIVTDDVGCVAELVDGLTVTDALTLAVDSMLPPFGWSAEETPVVIYARDPVNPPEEQFMPTPRAYLNPTNAGPGTVASALESVAFVDATRLNAVVPAGLSLGHYDLIVVNPDGAVGLLPDAFLVSEEAPPVVYDISPGSVVNQAGQNVTVSGDYFDTPAVDLTCKAPDDTLVQVSGVVNSWDVQYIDVTFDMSPVPAGSVCVLRVTNQDGTYFDYSALSVTNPSLNLSDFAAASSMLTPRRAPAAVAGRPTLTARFLYAAGGDNGSASGAYDSIEAAPVDPFGDLGSWFELPYALPGPRTLAGAVRIGRFVYIVGGNDGTSAVNTVYRAEVLRPGDVPEITDADIRLGDGVGLDGGTWYYRVAATFPANDPQNPGGESLASDPLVIQVPDRPEKINITLVWTSVPRASGYRIYRSPAPDMQSGSERLIAEVGPSPQTYTDAGDTAGTEAPLPFGSLGRWAAMPSMLQAREGAGVTFARDPVSADTYYIYAIGGRDETGALLSSYEYLPVTVEADGTHTVGAWTGGPNALGVARWQLAAFLADPVHAPIAGTDTWIYAGAGIASNAIAGRRVEAAQVQAGGDLGTWTRVVDMSPSRAGYGYTLANSMLYAFGGLNAQADDGGASARIIDPVPTLENWNNLGLSMTEPRYLMGSLTESAFIFLVGGWNGTAVTNSVEKTVW